MNKHRRFSAEEKYIIIEEAHHQPGGNISEVCRRHGISSSMFYRLSVTAQG